MITKHLDIIISFHPSEKILIVFRMKLNSLESLGDINNHNVFGGMFCGSVDESEMIEAA